MKLIDKDVLVAEIEKRKKEAESNCGGYKSYGEHCCDSCVVGFYEEFLEILNTLEMKEVDLDKMLTEFMSRYAYENGGEYPSAIDIAHRFFELGLNAQKGE